MAACSAAHIEREEEDLFREVEIHWSKEDSQSFMRKCLSKKVLGGNT